MPAPFYNAVKGTTSGTPGTGAFTPNAAAAGFLPWSDVPPGSFVGLVRFEDGTAWELCYSYWNGTTLSRGANQVLRRRDGTPATSTGSVLSLSSSATASMVVDAAEVQSHLGGTPFAGWFPVAGASTATSVGLTINATGTAAASSIATTNYLTEQPRIQYTTAATTTGTLAGPAVSAGGLAVYSTAAGRGGFELTTRFGLSALVATTRLYSGWIGDGVSPVAEPSANTNSILFGKDSADTNIQFMSNDNVGSCTKSDTGIGLVQNGWYEASVWTEPGGGRAFGLLIRLDTGAVWHGTIGSDLPVNGTQMTPHTRGMIGTVAGANIVWHQGAFTIRRGS